MKLQFLPFDAPSCHPVQSPNIGYQHYLGFRWLSQLILSSNPFNHFSSISKYIPALLGRFISSTWNICVFPHVSLHTPDLHVLLVSWVYRFLLFGARLTCACLVSCFLASVPKFWLPARSSLIHRDPIPPLLFLRTPSPFLSYLLDCSPGFDPRRFWVVSPALHCPVCPGFWPRSAQALCSAYSVLLIFAIFCTWTVWPACGSRHSIPW